MQVEPLQTAYFGKLPTFGDFVRHQATTPGWQVLDEWVQRGIRRLSMGPRRAVLDQALAEGAPFCFFFTPPRSPQLLVGVMQASADQAGRFYPFSVGCSIPVQQASPIDAARLPVRSQAFLNEAAAFVQEATAGEHEHRALADALPQVEAALAQAPRADSEHAAYLERTTFKAFAEAIWGHFDDSRKYLLFKNLLDVLAPFQRSSDVRLTYGLAFPTGSGPDAVHATSFWWELCVRMLRRFEVWPTCFWSPALPGVPARKLLFYFQQPGADGFEAVLTDDLASDAVCDLDRIGREDAGRAALSIPPRYGALIESPTLTLADFLRRVSSTLA